MGLRRLFYKREIPGPSVDLSGVIIPNPVGLVSGYDHNAKLYHLSANCMYGFIGIGPVEADATILKNVISSLQAHPTDAKINAVLSHKPTSHGEDSIIEDYNFAFSMLYDFCDLFTIDTSISYSDASTPLRDIALLKDVLNSMLQLRMCYQTYRPIIVKVRPEIPESSLDELLDFSRLSGIDAICVSFGPSTAATVKKIYDKTLGRYPIVGCVDVLRKEDCAALKKAGATLIAGGLSFMHYGPGNTKRIIKYLTTIK